MIPIGFAAGAASGATVTWLVSRGRAQEMAAEIEVVRNRTIALERDLVDHRAKLSAAEAQVLAAQERVDAARAEVDAARAEAHAARAEAHAARAEARAAQESAEVHRLAAAVTVDEATRRARSEVRDEVEREARAHAQRLIADARQQAQDLTREARDRHAELTVREQSLAQREAASMARDEVLSRREGELSSRDRAVTERERSTLAREAEAQKLVATREAAVEAVKVKEAEALERVASLTADDARRQVIERILEDAQRSAAREAKQIEDLAREEAEKRARRLVGIAVQRYAGDAAGERAVTSVHLPNDELKGRIIGREGRNIRTFQEVTGCDLVIDDTPETIVVSSFDPVRREMARITLERLIQDGRIHPTRIEEFFGKAKEEVERAIKDAGDQAIMELGLGRMHPDLVRLVGQLRYRYSYAQNILRHSVEVGHMCGLLAAEMGLNVKQAKRAGLLHDIGKAVTHEQEGGHAVIGGQMARKAGEDEWVVNAIAAHHDDEAPRSVLAHLTAAADAISGARPGARREMLESYVRRLEDLEKICEGFKGVEKSFAIQAGREVRVLVEPGEVDDVGALTLSREIARKIEDELAYPGQIRVTVVRETRAVDYAR